GKGGEMGGKVDGVVGLGDLVEGGDLGVLGVSGDLAVELLEEWVNVFFEGLGWGGVGEVV
uniref:hypothetical protein n=1 Tax=Neisseria sicca TaxID=490 RepID=UPI001C990B57